jgi:hypothetical protein
MEYKLNSKLRNEKGIALIMVLILAAVILVIMAGLVYMITSTTQISGMTKKYKTALQAGVGGAEVTFQIIQLRGDPEAMIRTALSYNRTISDACLAAKLNTTTSTANWATCGANATAMTIDRDDPTTYDFSFDLGTSPYPSYRGFAKIVDTVEGNSGGDEGLLKHGVVSAGSGEITVMSVPYLYTIEVNTENRDNPSERAKISVLYQY